MYFVFLFYYFDDFYLSKIQECIVLFSNIVFSKRRRRTRKEREREGRERRGEGG